MKELGKARSGVGFPISEQGGKEGIPFFKVSDMNTNGNESEMLYANNYVDAIQIKENGWTIISDVPAIIFAKVGAAVLLNRKRLVREPFLLDNNMMEYSISQPVWDLSFALSLFETLNLPSYIQIGALPSYNTSDIENIEIYLPEHQREKSAIGQLFSTIDSLIAAEKRKQRLLGLKKKTLLQRLFQRQWRFRRYTEPWAAYQLGNLYKINNERNKIGLSADKTISVSTMSFNDQGNGAKESSLLNYKIIRVGDIAFEGHRTKTQPYGRFILNCTGTGIMSPRFSCLRPKEKQILNFWKYYINNGYVMNRILLISTKSGTMMNELVFDDFSQQTIYVPVEKEQTAIGILLTTLDALIKEEKQKIDLLMLKKKALLQQMFV